MRQAGESAAEQRRRRRPRLPSPDPGSRGIRRELRFRTDPAAPSSRGPPARSALGPQSPTCPDTRHSSPFLLGRRALQGDSPGACPRGDSEEPLGEAPQATYSWAGEKGGAGRPGISPSREFYFLRKFIDERKPAGSGEASARPPPAHTCIQWPGMPPSH